MKRRSCVRIFAVVMLALTWPFPMSCEKKDDTWYYTAFPSATTEIFRLKLQPFIEEPVTVDTSDWIFAMDERDGYSILYPDDWGMSSERIQIDGEVIERFATGGDCDFSGGEWTFFVTFVERERFGIWIENLRSKFADGTIEEHRIRFKSGLHGARLICRSESHPKKEMHYAIAFGKKRCFVVCSGPEERARFIAFYHGLRSLYD